MQTKIHKDTFYGCTSLRSITLPATVLSVDDRAFMNCTQLESVTLGVNVKTIGVSAFCGDLRLTAVDRLNGTVSTNSNNTFDTVGDRAFYGTGLQTANLSLRSSAIQTFWGDGCFQDCKSLRSVHFLSANYMSRDMFRGCTALTSVNFDVHMMAYTYPRIFNGCANLRTITIPAELLFVPEGAFMGCSRLTSMAFSSYGSSSTINDMQKDAFNGCAITQLEVPQSIDSVDELDAECFSNMPQLQTVKFHGIGSGQIFTGSNPTEIVKTTGFFGLKRNVKVWCKDMAASARFQYTYDASQYRQPIRTEYASDTTARANFLTGKWYYNAEDVYNEARRKGMPCLFIYSLYGCGPCAIYQKKLWNAAAFQNWFKTQGFLTCGLECQQQPMYDKHLRFLVDTVSVSAKNFAKEDKGETLASKSANALGQKFRRYKVGESFASNLMTPVLIFMDKNGNCYDYTYHNLASDIRRFGTDGMLQQLKSLCLYHFDGNSLTGAKYVKNAGKAFSASDYSADTSNPWKTAHNVINMSLNVPEYEYQSVMNVSEFEQYMLNVLGEAGQIYSAGKIYLAGCLFNNFDWIIQTFGSDIETYTSASALNTEFQKWYIRIGDLYYWMCFDSADKIYIDNPCGDGKEYIYKVTFQQKSYPG